MYGEGSGEAAKGILIVRIVLTLSAAWPILYFVQNMFYIREAEWFLSRDKTLEKGMRHRSGQDQFWHSQGEKTPCVQGSS